MPTFPKDQTKEQICEALEVIREQNPTGRILLVLDNLLVASQSRLEFASSSLH